MKKDKKLVNMLFTVQRGNEDLEVFIDGWVNYTVDTRWGADADGNRWTARVFPEDVEGLSAYDVDGDNVELSLDEIEAAENALVDHLLEEPLLLD